MVRAIGNVTLYAKGRDDLHLESVLFQFNEGSRTAYSGESNTYGLFRRSGWLALNALEASNWQDTYMIDLSFSNGSDSEISFFVDSKNAAVVCEHEWVWFPVIPLRPYFPII